MNAISTRWSRSPFVRLIPALTAGILAGRALEVGPVFLSGLLAAGMVFIGLYSFAPPSFKFRTSGFCGLAILLCTFCTGALLVWKAEDRNNGQWAKQRQNSACTELILEEMPVQKPNSFKVLARINTVYRQDSAVPAHGKAIVYFSKDAGGSTLLPGQRILTGKALQEIRSSGNPGSFDFRAYCHLQGISHQVYLTAPDFQLLPGGPPLRFNRFIFACRRWVVATLKRFIPGDRESGLAEALLIGYKDDLDKELVQSYSNTGVVHVIAISGLHLGLIYGLLLALTRPLRSSPRLRLVRLVLVVSALWLFSILAGAQPSVLRSAVLFTFLAGGEVLQRRGSAYNSLALSAFLLLCYNPLWLWDIGFQLSYSAVLSIMLFFRPIYNWWTAPNRFLDAVWKLNAVTLSAQLLTTPVSSFHFHQLPVLFLFTNLVAVPLSSLVLFGEIVLCGLSCLPFVARPAGELLHWLIRIMNGYILSFDGLSFAIWDGLQLSAPQAVLATITLLAGSFWLMYRARPLLWTALVTFLLFSAIRTSSFAEAERQNKLIVYSVPKAFAMDLISGRTARYIGDTALLKERQSWNFHFRNSRILHRIKMTSAQPSMRDIAYRNKRILLIDSAFTFRMLPQRQRADLLILSGSPQLKVAELRRAFDIRQLVIASSVAPWRAARWQAECDSIRIPCYNIVEKGAFVVSF